MGHIARKWPFRHMRHPNDQMRTCAAPFDALANLSASVQKVSENMLKNSFWLIKLCSVFDKPADASLQDHINLLVSMYSSLLIHTGYLISDQPAHHWYQDQTGPRNSKLACFSLTLGKGNYYVWSASTLRTRTKLQISLCTTYTKYTKLYRFELSI